MDSVPAPSPEPQASRGSFTPVPHREAPEPGLMVPVAELVKLRDDWRARAVPSPQDSDPAWATGSGVYEDAADDLDSLIAQAKEPTLHGLTAAQWQEKAVRFQGWYMEADAEVTKLRTALSQQHTEE